MAGAGVLVSGVQVYGWGVFLCAWAQMGWVDWKEQKIRNRFIRIWLLCVLAGYAVLIGQTVLGAYGFVNVFILRDYYVALSGHLAVSIAAACALWGLRIWPAGDAKLFALLALCCPLMRLPGSFRSGLLFLEVLINIFVPAAAFLFLTAGEYLWRTRFTVYKAQFTDQVRGRYKFFRFPEFSFARFNFDSLRALAPSGEFNLGSAPAAVKAKAVELWEPVKKEILSVISGYRENPKQLLLDGASWFAMMAVMSMISYSLNDFITSNVLKTLFCFALMFTWSRLCQLIGTGWALGGVFAVCAFALYRQPHVNFPALAVIFGHITVFSLFIFLGMQLAMKLIAGKTGYMLLPFLMMLPGLIPWRFIAQTAWGWLTALVNGASRLVLPALPKVALPSLPAVGAVALPAWPLALDVSGLAIWALMGLAFGLALVFVKIWDSESYKTVPIAHIDRFMTLAPSLVSRIEADEDFRDEHFSTMYADGLTGEQAEALREWCREQGLETVPLAPTISFANWIFLGYFVTRLLEGHVLRFLY